MGKTVIDFILKYAESIKKEKLTSFHLLYAYACFSLMPVKYICDELELGEEDYGRISYLQGKINLLFDEESVKIDPAKLKLMIAQQVERLEKDLYAIEDYITARRVLEQLSCKDSLQEEAKLYSLLYNMIHNRKKYNIDGLNNVYLMRNKEFMLENPTSILLVDEIEKAYRSDGSKDC